MVTRTLLSLAAALAFMPPLFAAAPPNDKVAKAIVLKGTSGNVASTNVDATSEPGERTFTGNGNTVWYSFTAPTDGFLEVAVDATNSGGSNMIVGAFDVFPGRRFTFFQDVSNAISGFSGGRPSLVIPFARGITHKLQFDTAMFGGFSTGTFGFSYEFKTGSAFGLDAPSGGGLFFFREGGAISITVTRNVSTEGVASVDYELATDTADTTADLDAPSDPLTGTLTFQPGESRKALTFTLKQDALTEGQEVFDFKLSNPSAGSVVLNSFQNIYIDDDDGAPANDAFADAATVTGADVTQALPAGAATRETGEPGLLAGSVWYKWTAPSDGVLTISTTSNLFPCLLFTGTALDNLVQQRPTETPPNQSLDSTGYYGGIYPVKSGTEYFIAVARYDSAIGTADLKLRLDGVNANDNTLEAAIVSFTRDTYEVLESAGPATVTLKRTGGTTGKTMINFTTSKTTSDPEDNSHFDFTPFAEPGTDYVVKTETITFEVGETTKDIPITINNDTKKEGIEHFFVRLDTDAQGFVQLDSVNSAVVHINEGKALPSFGMFKATYSGVLEPASGVAEGTVTIALTATGKFTGSLVLNGAKFPLMGTFPPLPSAPEPGDESGTTLHITRTGLPDIVVDLRYDFDPNGFASINCNVSDGAGMGFAGTASPGFFSKQQPLPVLGTFTVILTPDTNVPADIRQFGFLTLDVKPKGTFKLMGGLPDGTIISGSGFMGVHFQGQFPRYDAHFVVPLYKGAGSLGGTLHLTHPGDVVPTPLAGDGFGTVRWAHPVATTGPVLTAFGAAFDAYVSRYTVPKGALALNVSPGVSLNVSLTGGGIAPTLFPGTLGAKNAVTFPPGLVGAPSVKFVPAKGLFSGKFTPTGAAKPLSFQGAVSRNRNTGTGYFLNGTSAGSVQLSIP